MSDVKIPEELLRNRMLIESNLILSFYKNTSLLYDYPINHEELLDSQAKTLYSLAKVMVIDNKYDVLDAVSVASFIAGKPSLEKFFNAIGLDELMKAVKIVNAENIDAFYEAYLKSNLLIRLYKQGFNILGELDKLEKMDSSTIIDYFEYKLNDSFQDLSLNRSIITDLTISDQDKTEIMNGEELGLSFQANAKLLNMTMAGLELGNVHYLSATSGAGKSSFMTDIFLVPFAEQGIKTCLISNELTGKQFKQMLISNVASRHFKYYDLTRTKIKYGDLNNEQKIRFDEVCDYINKNIGKNITFIEMFDYKIDGMKKVIKKLSKVGVSAFFIDTLKGEDMSGDNTVGKLVELSRSLFELAKQNNVAILCTYQLLVSQKDTMRYLTASAFANSKQVTEIAHSVILFRRLWQDEYDGQKYSVSPYRMKKGTEGKWNVKEHIKLDPNKQYIVLQIDKNRSGVDNVAILYEFLGHLCTFAEVGMCTVHKT